MSAFKKDKDRCHACGKDLKYSIIDDTYEFCDCTERFPNIFARQIPLAKDQVSIADDFEQKVQILIDQYCGQGMTIGSALGALQNRMFVLNLNIHYSSIVELVKRNLQ